jgi:hypothetical protein
MQNMAPAEKDLSKEGKIFHTKRPYQLRGAKKLGN